jgi:adenosine deaminase
MIVTDDSMESYFRKIPKVELHLHLEGAIPLPALWQLVQKYESDPSVPSVEALASKFEYRDFSHFLDTWAWKNRFLRQYEDFTFIACAAAEDLASQNVVYAEVFYSPADFRRANLDPQRITEAIRQGLSRVPGIEIALITDLVRDKGPERGLATLEAIGELHEQFGVIGIGIGGSEHLYPPGPFASVYRRARALGLRTTAHAGEACGPESVWSAIRELEVDRIGHAARAAEDPALVDYIAQRRIPLEICPISNLRTGIVPSISVHPVRTYFDRGIPLSINTDDPKLFNCSLADEYLALHRSLGFTIREIHSLIEQAVECSWLPDERKTGLLRRIHNFTRVKDGTGPGS